MNSSQEIRFQTVFCSDLETEALGADPGWWEQARWNSDRLFCLGWFTSLLSLHLLSSLGKWASHRYVAGVLNKVNDNTLRKGMVYLCHLVRFTREWEKTANGNFGFLKLITAYAPGTEVLLMKKLMLPPRCHALDFILGAVFPICMYRAQKWHLALEQT